MSRECSTCEHDLRGPHGVECHPCEAILACNPLDADFDYDTATWSPAVDKPCGRPDHAKPMAFRNERWCCGNHQKLVEAQDVSQDAALQAVG